MMRHRAATSEPSCSSLTLLPLVRVVYDFLPMDFNELMDEHNICDQGKTSAMLECNIGWCYLNGRGCSRDYKQAMKWFSKSSKQNSSAGSQYNMGVMYSFALGVDKLERQASEAFGYYSKLRFQERQMYEICNSGLKTLELNTTN
mmetsp:Transcript_31080/g.69970  ORF Transcript_31080/g.69970 Transcript_31080/m.69970 type:complete len:145 (-) Transcript_31080:14-448(-)